jgi:hypothetical protein
MTMLDVHEFSGTMTYETNLGLESMDFAYSLILSEEAEEELIESAAKALATFIVKEHIDRGFESSFYNEN